MWRSLASNMLTILAVGLFLVAGVVIWGQSQYTAQGPLEESICLRVEHGSNMTRVSRELAKQGAITSAPIFRVGADYTDKSARLKAGSFLVRPGASMQDIADQITRGGASTCGTEILYRVGVTRIETQVRELDPETEQFVVREEFDPTTGDLPDLFVKRRGERDTRYRVTLAEGVTSWQVTEALNLMGVLQGQVNSPPEGTLAPDSYEISAGEDRAAVLERMTKSQAERVAEAWNSRVDGLPLNSPEDLVILASIIEKETGVPEERRDVASVFVNRLNQGMRLQTDPTVIYGLTKGKGVLGRGLRQSELRKVTPWNTYVIEGLPPTPIANPGIESLKAAANPADTNFVFFVADGTGGHAFATTLQDHNRNVAKWRQIEAERANN